MYLEWFLFLTLTDWSLVDKPCLINQAAQRLQQPWCKGCWEQCYLKELQRSRFVRYRVVAPWYSLRMALSVCSHPRAEMFVSEVEVEGGGAGPVGECQHRAQLQGR